MTDLETLANDEAQVAALDTEVEVSTPNEVEDSQEEVVVQDHKDDKRPSSVVKLLKQRNELKKENETLKSQMTESEKLAKKVAEMEELLATQTLEQEAKTEKANFFNSVPQAKEFEADITKLKDEKGLDYDTAFKLYAATNKPELLLDEQYRNKATSTTTMPGAPRDASNVVDKNNLTVDDIKKLSPDEFLAWSDGMAKQSRASRGYTN